MSVADPKCIAANYVADWNRLIPISSMSFGPGICGEGVAQKVEAAQQLHVSPKRYDVLQCLS